MKVDKTIFRDYDIRGVAGEDASDFEEEIVEEYQRWYGPFRGVSITLKVAEVVGKAFGTYVKRRGGERIVIGYEERPFGKELANAFIAGEVATGTKVQFLGVSLTPLVYFAVARWGLDGGVNITGSHNVYFFNGFKLMLKGVFPLYDQELQGLRKMVEDDDYDLASGGEKEDAEVFNEYRKYLMSKIKLAKKFKVVIDSGNGSAGRFAPDVFRDLGCEVVEMYSEPNPRFPNHVPDPEMPENMEDLGEKVREVGADLGIGFDADADRLGVVDEKGGFVSADRVMPLFAEDILERHKGKTILFDVKSSELLNILVPEYGGVPLIHPTGHAPIKASMSEDHNIVLGGEVSGHFFWTEDYFRFDDGIWSGVKLLELLGRKERSLRGMLAGLPTRVATPEMKLPCADEKKFDVVEGVKKGLGDKYRKVEVDGVRFYVNGNAWGLVRASNTNPYLTVRVEGMNKEEVLGIKKIIDNQLGKFPEVSEGLDLVNVASKTGKLGWR